MANKTITFGTDILPQTDNTFILGTTGQRWKNIHGIDISGKKLIVHDTNENNKVTLQWNSTDSSLDFVFA